MLISAPVTAFSTLRFLADDGFCFELVIRGAPFATSRQWYHFPEDGLPIRTKSKRRVVLAVIDGTWLEKYVEDHPSEVPSARFGSRRMLTASTEQLQRLLIDNKDRKT